MLSSVDGYGEIQRVGEIADILNDKIGGGLREFGAHRTVGEDRVDCGILRGVGVEVRGDGSVYAEVHAARGFLGAALSGLP